MDLTPLHGLVRFYETLVSLVSRRIFTVTLNQFTGITMTSIFISQCANVYMLNLTLCAVLTATNRKHRYVVTDVTHVFL